MNKIYLSVLSFVAIATTVHAAQMREIRRFSDTGLNRVHSALKALDDSEEASASNQLSVVHKEVSIITRNASESRINTLKQYTHRRRNSVSEYDAPEEVVLNKVHKTSISAQRACQGAYDEKLAAEGPWSDETLELLENYRNKVQAVINAPGFETYVGSDGNGMGGCTDCFLFDTENFQFLVISSCYGE